MHREMMNLLGTPETNRRGLKTRNALNALTSKPSIWRVDKIVLTTLENTISGKFVRDEVASENQLTLEFGRRKKEFGKRG